MILIAAAWGDTLGRGGLFAVDGLSIERIDRFGSKGIAFDGRRFARALYSSEEGAVGATAIYDARGIERYQRLDGTAGCDDVAFDGDGLVVATAWDNAVRWFSPAGDIVREIVYPGPINSCHLNCITQHEGVWYATMFGLSTGKIVNLETGAAVVEDLNAPHSPRWIDGMWLVCNSGERELRAIDAASGKIAYRVACGTWTRGLAYDESFFYVGGCQRRDGGQAFGNSTINVIDRATWKVVDRIPLPAQEICSLLLVPVHFMEGLRCGFNVNPQRLAESQQYRRLMELGNEQPRDLWPAVGPLPWEDFRCGLSCTLPDTVICGELLELRVKVANRSKSFFSSAPPAPVCLSYKWLRPLADEYLDDRRAHRTELVRTIFPGETIWMTALVLTPDCPGPALLRITLVQEGVSWFDEQDSANGVERALTIFPAEASAQKVPVISQKPLP